MAPTRRRAADALRSARLEAHHHLFVAIAEEMGAALQRSAFSPNIKERRDFSCALFDARGRMTAHAAHIPVHLGALPLSVAEVLRSVELEPGDAVLLNDPYRGGTHLPDLTLVSPIFLGRGRRPSFLCANRAHHADVGGASPGSMAPVDDVHAEGLRIPPLKLVERGRVRDDVLGLLLANVRAPHERRADLLAQLSANHVAAARVAALAATHGARELARRSDDLIAWTAKLAAERIASWPARRVRFEDHLEPLHEGGAPIAIRVELSRRGRRLVVDFSASDDAVGQGLNATRAVTVAAVFYCLRLFLPAETPTNEGLLAPVTIVTRRGSVVDARYPAPVAAGNVETSQRLVDAVLGAFSRWLERPAADEVPAASAGTMSNLAFGVEGHSGAALTYYETIAGGAGASRGRSGASAVQTHMTNTRNTPIEALEQRFKARVVRCTVRRGSGGAGAARGGDGTSKHWLFLAPAQVSWVADRARRGPWGLAGGGPGATGSASVERADRTRLELAPRASVRLAAGDRLALETPGGGGFGAARSTAAPRAKRGAGARAARSRRPS
jgi:N-methylhydantoinase B